ncbi:MAG: phosphoribosyltransferase [Caldilinea sp. CFX5]|nr:phosphoribosyltransferase [Caldilinea sp. CFX5]
MLLFQDRADAGRQLAQKLSDYRGQPAVVVLGLPRGGVPVAFAVAQALHAPLDVFLVRKLGLPGHEELAMGAIASGGVRILNKEVIDALRIPPEIIEAVSQREERELARREQAYRADRPLPTLQQQIIILVDDGLATGASMAAAVAALRAHAPAQIVVAVPVAAAESCELFANRVDRVVCLATPEPFFGVGLWYGDFSQVRDEEVRALLARAAEGFTIWGTSNGKSTTRPTVGVFGSAL